MKNPNLDEIADIIANVAETEVMPRFRNLSVSDIATKTSADDLVTTADTETEKVLTARLTAALPDSLVVGEESCFQNPEVIEYLKQDKPVWVIDPVDGTMNFSYGRSEFGMVVALVSKGETVAGWLYNPVMKAMIYGEKGAGAWLRGKKRLSVSNPQELTKMHGVVGRRVAFRDPNLNQPVWWGAASFGYMMITTGEADYSAYRTKVIKPWDHAAGVMLHHEAGGYSAYTDGSAYAPVMGANSLISAPNRDIWEYLARNICAPAKTSL